MGVGGALCALASAAAAIVVTPLRWHWQLQLLLSLSSLLALVAVVVVTACWQLQLQPLSSVVTPLHWHWWLQLQPLSSLSSRVETRVEVVGVVVMGVALIIVCWYAVVWCAENLDKIKRNLIKMLNVPQLRGLAFEVKRPVQTGLNQSSTVLKFPTLWRTEDQTAVFSPLWSWEFAVLISLGPVQSWFFSGYKTGLANTKSNGILNKHTYLNTCKITLKHK